MKILRLYANQSGIALMVVLWVLVLLMALATEFAFSMKGEVNTTRNFKEDVESYHLAKAGVHLGMAEVLLPASFHALPSEQELVIGTSTLPIMDPKEEALEEPKTTYRPAKRKNIPLGRGTITYTLEDEKKDSYQYGNPKYLGQSFDNRWNRNYRKTRYYCRFDSRLDRC